MMDHSATLLSLPDELLMTIFDHLRQDRNNLLRLRTTCKSIHSVVKDQHWHNFVLRQQNAIAWRQQLAVELGCDPPLLKSFSQALDHRSLDSPSHNLRSCLSKIYTLRTEIYDNILPSQHCQSIVHDVGKFLVPFMTNLHTVSLADTLGRGDYISPMGIELDHLDHAEIICAFLDNLPTSVENLEMDLKLPHRRPELSASENDEDNNNDHWCVSLARLLPQLKVLRLREFPLCSETLDTKPTTPFKDLQEIQISNLWDTQGALFHRHCEDYYHADRWVDGVYTFIEPAMRIVQRAPSLKIFRLHAFEHGLPPTGYILNSMYFTLDFVENTTTIYPRIHPKTGNDVLAYRRNPHSQMFTIDLGIYGDEDRVRLLLEGHSWESTLDGTRVPVPSMTQRAEPVEALVKAHGRKADPKDRWIYSAQSDPLFEHEFSAWPAFLDSAGPVKYEDVFDDSR